MVSKLEWSLLVGSIKLGKREEKREHERKKIGNGEGRKLGTRREENRERGGRRLETQREKIGNTEGEDRKHRGRRLETRWEENWERGGSMAYFLTPCIGYQFVSGVDLLII